MTTWLQNCRLRPNPKILLLLISLRGPSLCPQIHCRSLDPFCIVTEFADSEIAVGTEQSPDGSGSMAVIDMEMLCSLVSRAAPADGASSTLLHEHAVVVVGSDAIFSHPLVETLPGIGGLPFSRLSFCSFSMAAIRGILCAFSCVDRILFFSGSWQPFVFVGDVI